jgi:CRP-like cAMP-binding protein
MGDGPIKLSVNQRELAGMIGTTRESVNKELRALREKNLISLAGRAILIHNIEALKRRIK